MRIFISILFLFLPCLTMAQSEEESPGIQQSNEWAKDVFKREYKKQIYEPFAGKIKIVSEGSVLFNGDLLQLNSSDGQYLYLLEHGVLHSGLFGGGRDSTQKVDIAKLSPDRRLFYNMVRTDSLRICCIRELRALSKSSQIKRYAFWLSSAGRMNPTEYYFELTNSQASTTTSSEEFIKGAALTFFYRGSIII